MIVTFISQCEKKAKKRTRRILDSFANRIGDNVWQTAITLDGLQMVTQLLRKTATKATAISCHRNRTSHTTELVWIIGNKRKFNEIGICPVNSTQRNIMKKELENPWEHLESIKLISTIAALLHDIGKSTQLFQEKLRANNKQADPYRHEWISLKLFLWVIDGCTSDDEVFERLENLDDWLKDKQPFAGDKTHTFAELENYPPLAKWLAWLIVTHHRLPCFALNKYKVANLNRNKTSSLQYTASNFFEEITAVAGWVSQEEADTSPLIDKNWIFDNLVLHSPEWQKKLKRYAQKARQHVPLQMLSQANPLSNPFLLNFSRLILMVADHNYSALAPDSKERTQGDPEWKSKLIANTDKTKTPNQALDEHLIGVAKHAANFSHALPHIQAHLPKLKDHDPLARNTSTDRFKWQNNAFKLCRDLSEISQSHGFFAVNMASTGCGKTIANARMAYALADPKKGSRFTIALGLRTLTLQTGYSLREDLHLNNKQLAILVGGAANRELFELNNAKKTEQPLPEDSGSESSQALIDNYVDSQIDISDDDKNLKLGVITQSTSAQQLLYSPVVTCTIDHLMQASEHLRGGHYIVPTLRLLSSDLILDEPDDFSESDLPALSRLVHLAGLYGSRLILSSATLQPDQVQGLFTAYLEGRKIYNQVFGLPEPQVPCLWLDENTCQTKNCASPSTHKEDYQSFLEKRNTFLTKQTTRRIGEIVEIAKENSALDYASIASNLLKHILDYHQRHHFDEHHKKISIGLIRMANIKPLIETALALYQSENIPEDTQIYLCTYHSQQVLALRNHLEHQLDQILNRKNSQTPIHHETLKKAIEQSPQATHHIFIVLASPVCEVGRDHDYDWALVEPSSMRSLIQLSGRIARHRPELQAQSPNVGIWNYNIKALKNPNNPAFTRPGYENKEYRLHNHCSSTLIRENELSSIDARPRITKPDELQPKDFLSDLEHKVLADLMNNKKINYVSAYWHAGTFHRQHTHLIRLSSFRKGAQEEFYIMKPEESNIIPYSLEQVNASGIDSAKSTDLIENYKFEATSERIQPWLNISLSDCLDQLKEALNIDDELVLKRFSVLSLPNYLNRRYWFHEFFGCWENS